MFSDHYFILSGSYRKIFSGLKTEEIEQRVCQEAPSAMRAQTTSNLLRVMMNGGMAYASDCIP